MKDFRCLRGLFITPHNITVIIMDFEKDVTAQDRFLHNVFAHITKITNFGEDSDDEENNSPMMTPQDTDIRYIPIEAIPGFPLGDDDNLVLIGHPSEFGNSYRLKNLRVIPNRMVRPKATLALHGR